MQETQDEKDEAAKSSAAASKADAYMAALNARSAELQTTGMSRGVAFGMAELESRIARWPEAWGDDLQVLIYGDFDAPDQDLSYPALGITVMAGKRENTIISTALCVVTARVKVSDKSLFAVLDAVERLNTFLGIWTIIDWGNRGIGWWCHLTMGTLAGVGGPFKEDGIETAYTGIERLPPEAKRKVRAALHWIREPKLMLRERIRSDTLRVYAGYWNAFECLVDAICELRPHTKMTKQEKTNGINKFISDRQGKLDAASLTECYKLFVNPGFVAKASHALRVCCEEKAEGYIVECFRAKPDEDRLYAVRNAINHGDIDSDSLQEMLRVEDKLRRLTMIVFTMLGQLVPFPYPVDTGPL